MAEQAQPSWASVETVRIYQLNSVRLWAVQTSLYLICLLLERKGKFNERFVHEGTNIIKGYNNQCVITTWDHNVETMGMVWLGHFFPTEAGSWE